MARAAPRTFKAVKPNRGIQARYRAVLDKFVDAMDASIMRFLLACYRRNEPVMASDAKLTGVVRTVNYRGVAIEIVQDRRGTGDRDYFSAYVGGSSLRSINGIGRRYSSIEAAEKAAKSAIDNASRGKAENKKVQRKERKRVAEKGLPADELQKAVRALARRWQKNMNEGAHELARHFSKAVEDRSSRDLETILDKSGVTVKFTMTPAQRDVLKATVNANVSLIKSLPAKHFAGVEQIVMQGVQNGRDLEFVSRKLQKQFGITKRRAALIARDQNNKATSALTRARQNELGIREAIWRHSGGGRHPRKSHIAADGKKFDIRKGMRIDGENIWPGELINCGCTSESVIPGI